MNVIEISQENAQQYLIDESFNRPVVVDFWAEWCAPCKQLMPLLEKLADEYAGAFLLAKVNADEQQGISQQLGVRSLPTVMVFKAASLWTVLRALSPKPPFAKCCRNTCRRPGTQKLQKQLSCWTKATPPRPLRY